MELQYWGLLKRRLVPVTVTGPLPARGTPVFDGAAEMGEMRFGYGDQTGGVGMALMRVEAMQAGRLTCGGATLVPRVPAWLDGDAE